MHSLCVAEAASFVCGEGEWDVGNSWRKYCRHFPTLKKSVYFSLLLFILIHYYNIINHTFGQITIMHSFYIYLA